MGVTVVVTATTAATVVMVTVTVVAMATVAAAIQEEYVDTERFPGMAMELGLKRGTTIYLYSAFLRTSSQEPTSTVFRSFFNEESCLFTCVCVCVCVRGAFSFSSRRFVQQHYS